MFKRDTLGNYRRALVAVRQVGFTDTILIIVSICTAYGTVMYFREEQHLVPFYIIFGAWVLLSTVAGTGFALLVYAIGGYRLDKTKENVS